MKRFEITYWVDQQVLTRDGWQTVLSMDYPDFEAASAAILDAQMEPTEHSIQRFVLRRQSLSESKWVVY